MRLRRSVENLLERQGRGWIIVGLYSLYDTKYANLMMIKYTTKLWNYTFDVAVNNNNKNVQF